MISHVVSVGGPVGPCGGPWRQLGGRVGRLYERLQFPCSSGWPELSDGAGRRVAGPARAWGGSGRGSGTAWFSRGGGEQAVAAGLVSEWVRGFDPQSARRAAWADVGFGQHHSFGQAATTMHIGAACGTRSAGVMSDMCRTGGGGCGAYGAPPGPSSPPRHPPSRRTQSLDPAGGPGVSSGANKSPNSATRSRTTPAVKKRS